MKKPQAPCLGCKDREVGCHSKCERYKEYAELAKKNREIRREMGDKEYTSRPKISQTEWKRRTKK